MPWRLAKSWAAPESNDGLLEKLANARSLLGVLVVVAVNLYVGSREVDDMLNDELWAKTVYNTLLAGGLLPVAMILVFVVTRREHRKELAWWPVVRSVGLMLLTAVVPMLGIVFVAKSVSGVGAVEFHSDSPAALAIAGALLVAGAVLVHKTARRLGASGPAALVVALCLAPPVAPPLLFLLLLLLLLLVVTPVVVVVVYVSCVAFWASRTCCWVGLLHPLLAPPLSAVVVTSLTIVSLVDLDTNGVPVTLWLWLTFGGLASTLALAVAEWVLLRRKGHRLRHGPKPGAVRASAGVPSS